LPKIRVEGKRSDYFLDSAEIAHSKRAIYDALDAVLKLRPYMLYDWDRCRNETVQNVWINGRRVLFMAGRTPIPRPVRAARLRAGEPPAVDSVLATIKSEHVAELRLVNCWDHSLPGMGMSDAIFVTLKPGVSWDWNRGTFIDSGSVGGKVRPR
jgi:hypothetical protein